MQVKELSARIKELNAKLDHEKKAGELATSEMEVRVSRCWSFLSCM